VFETAEPLSPAASNGLVNAYEWHEGRVSLLSSGTDEEPVGAAPGGAIDEVMVTPSGRDIFFKTPQKLLAQDLDSAVDLYDARLGAGFAQAPAGLAQCSGDACQGPLTNPAPLLVPGSVSQAAGENVKAAASARVGKARPRGRKRARHRRKRRVRAPRIWGRARHDNRGRRR
jgi:hypothetical protein